MLPGQKRSQRALLLGTGLIAAAGLAAYADCYSGGFVLDDIPSIPDNPTIRHLSDWVQVLKPLRGAGLTVEGRPVLNASFAFNYAFGGASVGGYHAVNVAIHLLAGLTLFGVLRRLSGKDGFAWAAALLWTVHPLTTAAVTYVVQRAESLMGLFYLATIYCFLRSAAPARRGAWSALSGLACWLGMGTKEVMVSAPLTVLLIDRCFVAGSFAAAWRARKGYYLALAASWILLGGLVWHTGSRGDTSGFGSGVAAARYWLTQPGTILHYLRLVIWPAPLVFDYGTQWLSRPASAFGPAMVVAGLAGAAAWGVVKNRPWGLLGFVFFAVLAPTSLVPGNRQTAAEQRMYLASIVVIVGLVALGLALRARLTKRSERSATPAFDPVGQECGIASLIIAGLLALILVTLTFGRNRDYRSSLALYGADVAHLPDNAYAQSNYATALFYAGRYAEAEQHFLTALKLNSDIQETEDNLANTLFALGRVTEAEAHYRHAIATHPRYAEAYGNLANLYLSAGRVPEARQAVETALRLKPDSGDAHDHLGLILLQENRLPEAVNEFRSATALDPARAEHWNNYGNALQAAGRSSAAIDALRRAVQLAPENPKYYFNWAAVEMSQHRYPAAEELLRTAIRLNPNVAGVHQNLGNTLFAEDRTEAAVGEYAIAARLTPDDPIVHYNFGNGLLRLGRRDEAVRELRRAVELNPDLAPAQTLLRAASSH